MPLCSSAFLPLILFILSAAVFSQTRRSTSSTRARILPPQNLRQHFEQMKVRIYGDIGIVNGIVITSDEHNREMEKTVFTDVFIKRETRWQAINAQENKVQKLVP